jgi:hypothetical protein
MIACRYLHTWLFLCSLFRGTVGFPARLNVVADCVRTASSNKRKEEAEGTRSAILRVASRDSASFRV